jgi:ABC-2 type transport system permease protein
LAQSTLFVAIFYGISAIWERDLGVLHRYLVSPAPRSSLAGGKALSSSSRALSQAVVVYVCAAAMSVRLSLKPADIATATLLIILGSALFSTFSLIIACIVRTRERFMGIGQVLTMPICFASNAIYPLALMPPGLQIVARINPLTYEVDGLRRVMLARGSSVYGLGEDLAVLALTGVLMIAIATRMYPRMTE